MGAMPVGCYKQMNTIKEGVIMRLQLYIYISYPIFVELKITWFLSGFSGLIPKLCWKNAGRSEVMRCCLVSKGQVENSEKISM